jgi:hypothetical protein
MLINEQVSNGLGLLNVTQMPVDDDGFEMRDLTEQEIEDKAAAQVAIKKLNIRYRVESSVGDIYDIVADVSKRISILERICLKTFAELYNSDNVSQSLKDEYKSLIDGYVSDVSGGDFKDRTDLETTSELFSRLKTKFKDIADIVQDEYNL